MHKYPVNGASFILSVLNHFLKSSPFIVGCRMPMFYELANYRVVMVRAIFAHFVNLIWY